MKKITAIMIILLCVAMPAFATNTAVDVTGTMTIGGTDTTDTLAMGLSNEIRAYYLSDGVAGTSAQWYVIGTYHLGGTNVFATAQDVTSLFRLVEGKNPGDTFGWTGLPQDGDSSNVWSGDVWENL